MSRRCAGIRRVGSRGERARSPGINDRFSRTELGGSPVKALPKGGPGARSSPQRAKPALQQTKENDNTGAPLEEATNENISPTYQICEFDEFTLDDCLYRVVEDLKAPTDQVHAKCIAPRRDNARFGKYFVFDDSAEIYNKIQERLQGS